MTRPLRRSNLPVYCMLLPSLLLLVFVVPTMDAIRLSFTDEMLIGEGYLNPQFVGLENFRFMLADMNFYNSLRVTGLLLFFSAWVGQFFTTVNTIGEFGLAFFLTGGGPARATELISIYIYSESFAYYQLGYGAAVGVVMLSLSVVLGILYVRVLGAKI